MDGSYPLENQPEQVIHGKPYCQDGMHNLLTSWISPLDGASIHLYGGKPIETEGKKGHFANI